MTTVEQLLGKSLAEAFKQTIKNLEKWRLANREMLLSISLFVCLREGHYRCEKLHPNIVLGEN